MQKAEPLCSVIIPMYNSERYIAEAVQSACNQTLKNIEIIVVDDASVDSSNVIVEELAQSDPRITIISLEKNMGVSHARNTGVQRAKGTWVAFLDSDDIWLPDKLEKQLKAAEQENAALCCTGAYFFAENAAEKYIQVPKNMAAQDILKGNKVITSSVVVKREVALRIPMERSELHEDMICWFRILQTYGPALGVDEPLVRYRVNPDSKSGNKLRSALMSWKTYKVLGIGGVKRMQCFAAYLLHGVRRYYF